MSPLQLALAAIVILMGLGFLALMLFGWARRRRRQQDVAELPATPAGLGAEPGHHGKYVATTAAGDPYDRIAARGLGFRGFATASVHDEGLLIERVGERALWIPRAQLLGVGRATWTIDRVVEENGLHLIRWRLGERELDTYLRIDEPAAFDEAIKHIAPKEVSA